jgi:UDP-N-acetylmuramoylalanine-D-glutamate ligase
MINFKDKQVAIIGEGLEGLFSAKYLKSKGAKVTILDQKHGDNYLQNLNKYDYIVRSPGVKPDLLENIKKTPSATEWSQMVFRPILLHKQNYFLS